MTEDLLKPGQTATPRTTTLAIVICAVCMLALAPFLRNFEFSNGGENAVVASVQEIHRGGPWLVPTLHEEQRTKKPPLATWLSAIAVRSETTKNYVSADPQIRREAFSDFALEVRWPALLAMTGVLVCTYVLGTQLAGPRLGICATIICSTTLFWLQSARLTTTDAHLALWVTLTNCLLATFTFSGRPWPALVLAGLSLGLAMMSKGPVALIQTIVPIIAFLAWQKWKLPTTVVAKKRWKLPLLLSIVIFLLIGVSWYVMVFVKKPDVWAEWKMELTREGATNLEPSKWYNYAGLPLFLFPWTFFMIVGLVGAVMTAIQGPNDLARARAGRIVFALFLILIPIVIMSFFRDRKMRYLTPLLAPSSIIAAWGIFELLATIPRKYAALMIAAFHWLPLAVAGIGLGLAASTIGASFPASWTESLKTAAGEPWFSQSTGIILAVAFAVLILAAMVWQSRGRLAAIVVGAAVVMLTWNAVFNEGYRTSREGSSEMRPLAELILKSHPDAEIYSYRADRTTRHSPIDLSIYLNRAVKAIKEPADLSGATGPRVLIIRQKQMAPLENPSAIAPAEGGPWTFFAATPVDESIWYAFTSVP